MADEIKTEVTLEELMESTLAMTDALAKLLIAKGIITDAEFKAQLSVERANYLSVPKRLHEDRCPVYFHCQLAAQHEYGVFGG